MSDNEGSISTAVHALETPTSSVIKRRHHRSGGGDASTEKDANTDVYDEYSDEEEDHGEVGPEPSRYEDCITFIVVVAIIGGMIGLFWFVFTQVAASSDLAQHLQNMPKVDAKNVPVHVTLDQLHVGHTAQIDVDRQLVCRHCAGTGVDLHEGYHQCHECKGSGVRTYIQRIGPIQQHVRSACNVCKGKGQVANKQCGVCHGHGHLRDRKQFDVVIDRGMRHGDTVVVAREGDQSMRALPGDVVVHLHMKPHSVFTRRGDDLELDLEITLLESLVGFTREVVHLDKRRVTLSRDQIVTPDTVWRIPNEGMPVRGTTSHFGDLLVRFVIKYPTTLSERAQEAVAELLAA